LLNTGIFIILTWQGEGKHYLFSEGRERLSYVSNLTSEIWRLHRSVVITGLITATCPQVCLVSSSAPWWRPLYVVEAVHRMQLCSSA